MIWLEVINSTIYQNKTWIFCSYEHIRNLTKLFTYYTNWYSDRHRALYQYGFICIQDTINLIVETADIVPSCLSKKTKILILTLGGGFVLILKQVLLVCGWCAAWFMQPITEDGGSESADRWSRNQFWVDDHEERSETSAEVGAVNIYCWWSGWRKVIVW